jgi:hypothetical protein
MLDFTLVRKGCFSDFGKGTVEEKIPYVKGDEPNDKASYLTFYVTGNIVLSLQPG